MKIAIIYDVAYPFVNGGVEKRNFMFAKSLAEKHEVHLFSMNYWGKDEVLVKDGIRYHGIYPATDLYTKEGKRKIFPPIGFSIALMRKIFSYDFDVVECSAFPYFPVFICALYGLVKKRKVFITWHEYWGKYWKEYLGILGIFGAIIEKIALFVSPNIIAVSPKTMRDIIKAGAKQEKISLIGNGVSITEMELAPPSKETSDIIFIGRLLKHKNADLLVNAIQEVKTKIPNVFCMIIGKGPEEEKIKSLIKLNGLEKNVILKNNVKSEEELFGLLKSSKVLISASEREGFGITIIEAKAAGIPSITLNHENNASVDLIKDDGLLFEKNSGDLAEKIIMLLKNKSKHKKFSITAKYNAPRFAWSAIAEKFEKHVSGMVVSHETSFW